MKKLSIYIIALVLILTGCNKGANNQDEANRFNEKNVEIINHTNFDFQVDSFTIYYENNELIFYLEVNDYVSNMKNMFEDNFGYEVNEDIVRFYLDAEDSPEVIFDFENNTVSSSYVDAGNELFKANESAEEFIEEYESYFIAEDEEFYEIVTESTNITYNLSDYDIEIVREGEDYYVPFHVLQFMLSEYEMKLVYNGEEFNYLEVYSDEVDYGDMRKDVEFDQEVVDYNTNFNRMIFDNYYGLKDYVDYENDFDRVDYSLKDGSYKEYFDEYDSFVASLEDLHTATVQYMYTTEFDYSNDTMMFYMDKLGAYFELGCANYGEMVTFQELSEKTALLFIPGFSEERFATQYFEVLEEARGYENIVLDLSCNLGGYAGNTTLFNYPFTNDDIYMYSGDVTGAQTSYFARKRENTELFDNNIYVLTSSSSFSAGNYAPVMFHDMEFGTNIGEPSGGGTAAIAFIVMPNGAVTTVSSGGYLLLDENLELVESGVEIDIPIDYSNASNFTELYALVLEAIE